MKITEDVRKYAAEQKVSEEEALQVGLHDKAQEFKQSGADLYAKRQWQAFVLKCDDVIASTKVAAGKAAKRRRRPSTAQ